ncbi:MAG: hypothetical protein ACYDEQ_12860, partial [Desulfocucumaceae bacterium]
NEFILSERGRKLRFENLASSGFDKENSDSEYIICGSWMKALEQVWLVRFAVDVPAYYAFRFKEFGPVWGGIASLVVGAVQASVDTSKLLDNKEIGIFEVFPPAGKVQDIKVNYKDTLRLVAYLNSDKDGKLTRIAGKIGEKTGVDLKESSTSIFGDVTVSVRLWFLPAVGVRNMESGPFGTVIKNGRCFITKGVEYGY